MKHETKEVVRTLAIQHCRRLQKEYADLLEQAADIETKLEEKRELISILEFQLGQE